MSRSPAVPVTGIVPCLLDIPTMTPMDLRTHEAESNPLAPEVERLWCVLAKIQAYGGKHHPQTGAVCDGAWCAAQAGAALET